MVKKEVFKIKKGENNQKKQSFHAKVHAQLSVVSVLLERNRQGLFYGISKTPLISMVILGKILINIRKVT